MTLASHQGPHGEIPSNVDPATKRVSYGGTAGRVDADLWFVVACGQYWRKTGDEAYLQAIRDNYWVADASGLPDDVYHDVLFKNARRVEGRSRERYFLPFFSPVGYGYRFDAMANIFASLLGVATSEHSAIIDEYIAEEVIQDEVMVFPAFHPVITPKDEDWRELQISVTMNSCAAL